MAGLLPSANTCCDPCDEPLTTAVPGPAGAAGADGSDGADGTNAFTATTAQFTMPAELANVTIAVGASSWAGVGQIVYIEAGGAKGHFEVVSKPGATSMIVKNLEDAASSAYLSNSAAGTIFASGATVSPAGPQGPDGTAASAAPLDATYIVQTSNATLTNEQVLASLATGLVKNTTATGVLSIGVNGTDYYGPGTATPVPLSEGGTGAASASAARSSLGLAIGTDVQAYDALLTALSALGTAADRLFYTTGIDTVAETAVTNASRTLLALSTYNQWKTTLGIYGNSGLLGSSTGVDHNAVADTAISIAATRYIIDKVVVDNASISLTTATAGLFTSAGGAGTTIVANTALSALTASTKFDELTLEAVAGTDVFTNSTLYYRVGTAQGAAATANVWIFGRALA